jgi:hypothetical protein
MANSVARRARSLASTLTLALCAGALVPGCGDDECFVGMAACDGDVAVNCQLAYSDSSAPYVLERTPCGEEGCIVVDVDSEQRAECIPGECESPSDCPRHAPFCENGYCARAPQ